MTNSQVDFDPLRTLVRTGKPNAMMHIRSYVAANRWTPTFSPIGVLILVGASLLIGLLWFNSSSAWISRNGGLASWLQAIGSLYAIFAVSFPVYLERRLELTHARHSVLASAQMASDLMVTVANRAFDENAKFSEWWVPQWQVIDEVMASCPIHDIHSAKALEAFVTIRELYGRMQAWDDTNIEPWPMSDSAMQSYVGSLCLNVSSQLNTLKAEFSQRT